MAMEVQMPRLHHCDLEKNAAENFPKIIREALNKFPKKMILDLWEFVLQRWNQILLVVCVIALSTDPLFFYLLSANTEQKCLTLDRTMGTMTTLMQFIVDFFYIFHIIFQFRASIVSHSFQASRQGESVTETRARARKYLLMYLLVDMLIILPLPQVLGALWYFFSIQRIARCWREVCESHGVQDSTHLVAKISYCFWLGDTKSKLPRPKPQTHYLLKGCPLREVPILQTMDEQLLEAICKHLTPVLYAKNSIIFHEGEPLAEMLFVTRGELLTYTASAAAARVRFIGKGDFYRNELFDWVLINCASLSNFPLSTETVEGQTEVEV
ncbi:cyclic nucleotide-gated ion channel 1-like [Pyrus ussuriensis x Pyrus communis]|uniref:Cyclic nucleotide-gated ion channel 1-like n=1 Tax=Pyrus ussuriensis x Pyrus communis TaxID=2448454 RepID=A0A5N5F6S8_9ROSA|nr:cyclic nucleotide-gated ion channel 1-like [Pyrus ussuriensis x Pyrus communis]